MQTLLHKGEGGFALSLLLMLNKRQRKLLRFVLLQPQNNLSPQLSHLGYYRLSSTCQPSPQQQDVFPPPLSRVEDGRGSQTMGLRPLCNHLRRKKSSKGRGSGPEKGAMGQKSRATIHSDPSHFPEFLVPPLNPSPFAKNCDPWFCGSASNSAPPSSD